MWYLSIIISIIVTVIIIVYLSKLFSKLNTEWKVLGGIGNIIAPFNTFYPNLSIYNNFSNIRSNIFLKEAIFIVVSFIIHKTDSLDITYLYIFSVLLAWWVFNKRRTELNNLSRENKEMFKTYIFSSYITIPIFQTILYFLCYLTYLLNEYVISLTIG